MVGLGPTIHEFARRESCICPPCRHFVD